MKQTLGQYIDSVNLFIYDATDGEIELSDLPDVVDIAYLWEMGETSPKTAARMVLKEVGYTDFSL